MLTKETIVRIARVRRKLIKSRYSDRRKNRLGVQGKICWRTARRKSA